MQNIAAQLVATACGRRCTRNLAGMCCPFCLIPQAETPEARLQRKGKGKIDETTPMMQMAK